MQYLNIAIADLHHPNYIGSEPVDRATWLNLMAFCAERENGGIIANCAGWKSRMWEQLCGVTLDEVRRDCALWEWRGNDLAVWNYPVAQEMVMKKKRSGGYLGGKRSGEARREALPKDTPKESLNHPAKDSLKDSFEHSFEDSLNEKKRKGIGIGKEKTYKKKIAPLDAAPHSQPEALTGVILLEKSITEIFQSYPRRVGKPAAIRAIRRAMKKTTPETLLAATRSFAAAWQGATAEELRFCPHPSTWFNQERFNDDPSTWSRPQPAAQSTPAAPAAPSTAPDTISPSMKAMLAKTELERVEAQIKRIREQASHTAWGPQFTPDERAELKSLAARRSELVSALGFKA